MKKIFLPLMILMSVSISHAESDSAKYVPECKQIIIDLNTIVNAKNFTHNKNVQAAVNLCLEKLKNEKLAININDSIPKDIFGGAQFQFSTDNSTLPEIQLSPFMIDLYKTKPSIVLSAIVHEMQHARNYFDNPSNFIAMHSSDLERYLYELDAYNIEANFINTYLSGEKFSLTKYETILSKSYTNDNLDNFSFGLLGFDMGIAFYLYGIERKPMSYEQKIAMVTQRLTDILNQEFEKTSSEWDNYSQVVPIYTVLKFAPQAIRNIDAKHNKITDPEKYSLKINQPALYNSLIKLEEKLNPLSKYYFDFLQSVQKDFKKI